MGETGATEEMWSLKVLIDFSYSYSLCMWHFLQFPSAVRYIIFKLLMLCHYECVYMSVL